MSLVCVSVFAPTGLALAENRSVGTPSSHAARTQLTCVATKLQLGEVAVGQTRDKLIAITNSGRTPLIVLSAAPTDTEFVVNGLDLPLTLAAGESFTFRLTFAPQKSGRVDGSISIVSEASTQALTIHLSGTGRATGQLQVTPAAIDFRDARAGSNRTQSGQLTAIGANVTVSSATISSNDFQLGGMSFPLTIPVGHSVPFTVAFIPQGGAGSYTVLSFVSDAKNSLAEQAVTVPMVGPPPHKVQLSWKASDSKHIVGYNVYRGTRSGGPYKKINRSLDPGRNYTDVHVIGGYRYYYVAAAVNVKGQESKYSKEVQAVIP